MSQALPVLIAQVAAVFQEAPPAGVIGVGTLELTLDPSGTGTTDITGAGTLELTLDPTGVGSTDVTGTGSAEITLDAAGVGTLDITGVGTLEITLDISGTTSSDITGVGSLEITLDAGGAGTTDISGAGALEITLDAAGTAVTGASSHSGLLCPDTTLQQRYAPRTAFEQALNAETSLSQRYTPIVSLHSSCHDGGHMAGIIDDQIYPDNDAALTVIDLPTALTVEWRIAATAAHNAPAIGALTGVLSEDNAGPDPVYRGVVEGEDITSELLPTYLDTPVFLHVWSGQDFHVVAQTTVVGSRAA